ncbi:MAG: hypothetical protein M1169_03990 [Firmicutes bacterium]|nr:hypothetical protein [Bacillota bacterium]
MNLVDPNWYQVTMLFPLTDNEGERFSDEVWMRWRRKITSLQRAFMDEGAVNGWWQGKRDGQYRKIVVNVNEKEKVDQLRIFLQEAIKMFRQKAMYLEYHLVWFEEVR